MPSPAPPPFVNTPLQQQVNDLVQKLNQQTLTVCVGEFEKLITSFGFETYKCLLRSLILNIDLRADIPTPEYQTRITLLRQVFARLINQPNFFTIIIEVFSTLEGSKSNILNLISRKVEFNLVQEVYIALAFTNSDNPSLKLDGILFLKSRLPQIRSKPNILPANIASAFLYLVKTHPEFEQERNAILNDFNVSHVDPNQLDHDSKLARFIVQELGVIATASVDLLRDIFKTFQKDQPNERAIACLIGAVATNHSGTPGRPEAFKNFIDNFTSHASKYSQLKPPQTWNVDNLCTVIKETAPQNINWPKVIQCLDYPDFKISDKKGLATLVHIYTKISSAAFPIREVISRLWNNRLAQLQILILGLNFPPSTLNFADPSLPTVKLGPVASISSSSQLHTAWSVLPFVVTLLNLAEGDRNMVVKQLFESAIQQSPHRMLLVLAEAEPSNRSLQVELLSDLLPKYVKNEQESRTVLHQLMLVNPLLFSRALSDTYSKDPSKIDIITDLVHEMKAVELVLADVNTRFTVDFAIVSSVKRENHLNFSLWMKSTMKPKSEYVPSWIELLQESIPKLPEGKQHIPLLYISILFKNLFQFKNLTPQNVLLHLYNSIPKSIQDEISKQGDIFNVPNDIEEQANSHIQRVLRGDISIDQAIQMLSKFKSSPNDTDKQLFACMIHNLLDEYRFFEQYPLPQLRNVAQLFGAIVKSNVITGKTLELARFFIFRSLTSQDAKLLDFGVTALDKFKELLPNWPEFCSHLRCLAPNTLNAVPDVLRYINSALDVQSSTSPAPSQAKSSPPPSEERSPSIFRSSQEIDVLRTEQIEMETPPQQVKDKIAFMINNVSASNMEQKVKEFKKVLEEKYYAYFSYYLVVERVTDDARFHQIYSEFLDALEIKQLDKMIMRQTYVSIKNLLKSPKTKTELSERQVLKFLGNWLGVRTLAKNRPILTRDLDLKQLVIQAFESGNLLAIIPFVGKILSHAANSMVFKPPNPWTTMMLSLLAEIHNQQDVKLHVKFEVEILCKNLTINLQDVPTRDPPLLAGRVVGEQVMQPKPPSEQEFDPDRLPDATIMIPELKRDVKIRRDCDIFAHYPALQNYVTLSLDQTLVEVFPVVVKKFVPIACRTTAEIVQKDFCMDPDVQKMQHSAIFMASTLASKLAMVSSKETLRASFAAHLKAYLDGAAINLTDSLQKRIDDAIRVVIEDNVPVGLQYVEKAAREKAHSMILEMLTPEIQERNSYQRNSSSRWTNVQPSPYMAQLPEQLASSRGVLPYQLTGYDSFASLASEQLPSFAYAEQFQKLTRQYQQQLQSPPPRQQLAISLEETATLCNKCLQEIYDHAEKLNQNTSLFDLRPDNEIVKNLLLLPQMLKRCADVNGLVSRLIQDKLQFIYQTTSPLLCEIHVLLIRSCTKICPQYTTSITKYWCNFENNVKYSVGALKLALEEVLEHNDVDYEVSNAVAAENMDAIKFAIKLLTEGTEQKKFRTERYVRTLEQLFDKVAKIDNEEDKQFVKNLHKKSTAARQSMIDYDNDVKDRDIILQKFREWITLCDANPKMEDLEQFVTNELQQPRNLLSTDSDFLNMCKVLMKQSITDFYEHVSVYNGKMHLSLSPEAIVDIFYSIDAFCKLVSTILRMTTKSSKATLLTKVLTVASRYLVRDHELSPEQFNQRAYGRIFSNLLAMTYASHEESDYNVFLEQFAQTFLNLNPSRIPGFSFAWIDLISHRLFMPKLLGPGQERGHALFHVLIHSLFRFLKPHMEKSEIPEPVKHLYKATLKILLVLLHDFSEFLCQYHFTLCDEISPKAIQMRNLVLSAFPRQMKLPDPFAPNLKVDLLPETKQAPIIMSKYTAALEQSGLKEKVDFLMKNRTPVQQLNDLKYALLLPTREALESGRRYNVELINSLVLYVGDLTLTGSLVERPSTQIYERLIKDADAEGRYLILSAIANQLRYPNTHSHYFSCVLLYLFSNVVVQEDEELLQEQIMRVLLERLVVNRPQPWGLWITFIELVRNPRYGLLSKSFVNSSPSIRKLFDDVKG